MRYASQLAPYPALCNLLFVHPQRRSACCTANTAAYTAMLGACLLPLPDAFPAQERLLHYLDMLTHFSRCISDAFPMRFRCIPGAGAAAILPGHAVPRRPGGGATAGRPAAGPDHRPHPIPGRVAIDYWKRSFTHFLQVNVLCSLVKANVTYTLDGKCDILVRSFATNAKYTACQYGSQSEPCRQIDPAASLRRLAQPNFAGATRRCAGRGSAADSSGRSRGQGATSCVRHLQARVPPVPSITYSWVL